MKKKIIIPIITLFWIMTIFCAACDRPTLPRNPYGRGSATDLPEQNFSTAFEAFGFGKAYFEETAKFYETTFYGIASPTNAISETFAGKQVNYTRRYLSTNGDFLYDAANDSSKKPLGIDPSFSFVTAVKGGENSVYYSKYAGDGRLSTINGIQHSDYSDLALSDLTKASMAEYEAVCGLNPKKLFNYIVNSNTIISTSAITRGGVDDDYAFAYRLTLNAGAHDNYRQQVYFNGGFEYSSFSSLTLDFAQDIYGRIIRITTNEEYSVEALGGSQKTKLTGTQYISYEKNPLINFNGFTVSYAEN